MFMLSKIFKSNKNLPNRNLDEIKSICKIVFIDDQDFNVVDILKSAGWKNTRRVPDIESTEDMEIKEAHIIFVDIHGVGKSMNFSDEGLGLIGALKEKYPSKKVIMYSSRSRNDIFSKGVAAADEAIRKNADPFEFQKIVEKHSREVFSLNECIKRIQEYIYAELGRNIKSEKIMKKIRKVTERENFSVEDVSRIFNIENAAKLSQIIMIFMGHEE